MWFLLYGFIFIILIIILDYLYKRRRYRILKLSRIVGPSNTLPLIGDFLETIGNDDLNVFALMERLGRKFGKVFHIWAFHRLGLVIRDPKYFEVILSSQQLIKKPFLYDMFRCWLGDGLLLSYGPKWHARRKILTATYHFKILEEFVEVFDRQSKVLVKTLEKRANDGRPFDIFPIVCLTALDIIAETAMGVQINAQTNPDFPYAKAVKIATNILGNRAVKPEQYYDIGFLLTAFPSFLKLRKCAKIMHNFTNRVINDRRARMMLQKEKFSTDLTDDMDVGQKKRLAFLDVLLHATTANGEPLSEEDIREEVDTFMFEGHDTTTSGISFCLYLLSRHSDIQQKVFKEIIEILGPDHDKTVTMKNLQELKYLEACIKESLRMYPSVPIVARQVLQDINVGEKVIPANSTLVLLLYAAGRDGDYYHEPDKFNPERFFSEPPDSINPFANVPFSAGPRNCIGQKFAILEMKSTISRVLRHFELLPLGEDVAPVVNLILRSRNGIQLGLRQRCSS